MGEKLKVRRGLRIADDSAYGHVVAPGELIEVDPKTAAALIAEGYAVSATAPAEDDLIDSHAVEAGATTESKRKSRGQS